MKGLDVYSGTNIASWSKIKSAGYDAVYIKVTEGRTYTNPRLDAQYKGAKAAGLLVGMYHFAGYVSTVAQEYANYMNIFKKYKLDFKPCLDYEVANVNFPFIKAFMALNSDLILYASHNVADKSGIDKSRIWIAEPNTAPTSLKGYAAIQYNWFGNIDGLNGNADLDLIGDNIFSKGVSTMTVNAKVATKKVNYCLEFQLWYNKVTETARPLVADGIYGTKTQEAFNNMNKYIKL